MLVEVQVVQVMLQGGALGVLIYFAVWVVNRGIPLMKVAFDEQRAEFLREMEQKRLEYLETLKAIEEKHEERYEQQRTEFINTLKGIEERHAVEQEDCRKERRDMAKQASLDREADRTARHSMINQLQMVIVDVYRKAGLPNPPTPDDKNGK